MSRRTGALCHTGFPAMASLQIGDSIGSYQILEKINSGGMGTVYRAHHCGMKQDVALKVMLPELAADPEYRARFTREAMTLAALRHPNIVQILDANFEGDVAYYAMELLSEQSLRDELAHLNHTAAKVDAHRAVAIVRPLAVALDYAHTMCFVHRDIKPSNILKNAHGS